MFRLQTVFTWIALIGFSLFLPSCFSDAYDQLLLANVDFEGNIVLPLGTPSGRTVQVTATTTLFNADSVLEINLNEEEDIATVNYTLLLAEIVAPSDCTLWNIDTLSVYLTDGNERLLVGTLPEIILDGEQVVPLNLQTTNVREVIFSRNAVYEVEAVVNKSLIFPLEVGLSGKVQLKNP
ncbi:hypothetical protein [Algivirga pacifica]|uniref:DUF4382 domain-containing protein n=1 Tax=Algivirga pacifica TaxID=1162670 RepID=A0ABP9DGP1_9BACT